MLLCQYLQNLSGKGNPTGTHALFSKPGLLVARWTPTDTVDAPEREGGWPASTPGEPCIISSISSITCSKRETKVRSESQQEGLAFLLRGLRGADLLRGQERLLGEAGDDDGVHVQLLPQLLFVQQLGPPLVTGRTGGGKLIKALNPGATSGGRFVTWFWGG